MHNQWNYFLVCLNLMTITVSSRYFFGKGKMWVIYQVKPGKIIRKLNLRRITVAQKFEQNDVRRRKRLRIDNVRKSIGQQRNERKCSLHPFPSSTVNKLLTQKSMLFSFAILEAASAVMSVRQQCSSLALMSLFFWWRKPWIGDFQERFAGKSDPKIYLQDTRTYVVREKVKFSVEFVCLRGSQSHDARKKLGKSPPPFL